MMMKRERVWLILIQKQVFLQHPLDGRYPCACLQSLQLHQKPAEVQNSSGERVSNSPPFVNSESPISAGAQHTHRASTSRRQQPPGGLEPAGG